MGGNVVVGIEGMPISTEAGPNGGFRLDNVPVGLHTLVARTHGKARLISISVEEGAETDIGTVVLVEAGQISGLVTSAVDGSPIENATVTVSEIVFSIENEMPHPVREAMTDANGSYTVSALPVGDYLVAISKNGFYTVSLVLTVEAGVTTPGDAVLSPANQTGTGSVAGTVYLTSGGKRSPLPGVLVKVMSPEEPIDIPPLPGNAVNEKGEIVSFSAGRAVLGKSVSGSRSSTFPRMPVEYYAYTNQDGKYRIDGIPAGEYTVLAMRPGMEYASQGITIVAGSTARVDFDLTMFVPKTGTIEGTVTDEETGAPISGACVYALWGDILPAQGESLGPNNPGGVLVGPASDGYVMCAITDELGHYRLELPTHVSAIGVWANGYAQREITVTVVANGTQRVDVQLKRLSEAKVSLSGHVYADEACTTPVAGAKIVAAGAVPYGVPHVDLLYEASTDQSGAYRIILPAGSYVVTASKGDMFSEPAYLDIFENTAQDFVLVRGHTEPGNPGQRSR